MDSSFFHPPVPTPPLLLALHFVLNSPFPFSLQGDNGNDWNNRKRPLDAMMGPQHGSPGGNVYQGEPNRPHGGVGHPHQGGGWASGGGGGGPRDFGHQGRGDFNGGGRFQGRGRGGFDGRGGGNWGGGRGRF
jgi:hypothetical protein